MDSLSALAVGTFVFLFLFLTTAILVMFARALSRQTDRID